MRVVSKETLGGYTRDRTLVEASLWLGDDGLPECATISVNDMQGYVELTYEQLNEVITVLTRKKLEWKRRALLT